MGVAPPADVLSQLVLDWIHAQWLEDEKLTLDMLGAKKHLLYSPTDSKKLSDCQGVQEGSETDSELVQDYKKINKEMAQEGKKVRATTFEVNDSLILQRITGPSALQPQASSLPRASLLA